MAKYKTSRSRGMQWKNDQAESQAHDKELRNYGYSKREIKEMEEEGRRIEEAFTVD